MDKYHHATHVKLNGEYLLYLRKNEYEYCYSSIDIRDEIKDKILESNSKELFEMVLAQQKFNNNPVNIFGEEFKLTSIT
jgi:hypothetical protein